MATMNIQLEVPVTMAWTREDFVAKIKKYAKALALTSPVSIEQPVDKSFENQVWSLCGAQEQAGAAEDMCKAIRASRQSGVTRKIVSFDEV